MIKPTLVHDSKITFPLGKYNFNVTVVTGLDLAAPCVLKKLALVTGSLHARADLRVGGARVNVWLERTAPVVSPLCPRAAARAPCRDGPARDGPGMGPGWSRRGRTFKMPEVLWPR